MSAEIITFPRPFQQPIEKDVNEAIDLMVRIISKHDKRGEKAIRESVLKRVAGLRAIVRASRKREEG
jgi:hypothetical protein